MQIREAAAYAELRDSAYNRPIPRQIMRAIDLALDIFAEADERQQPFTKHSPESWKRKWLPSKTFRLTLLPLNAAALPCAPRGPNLVLKKIHAREEKPIIVDYNRNQVGATMNGYVPQVIVIDGKHRFKAAALRGETHILAWVGEIAAETMQAMGGGGGPAPESTTPATGASLVAKRKVKAQSQQEAALSQRGGRTFSADVAGPATKSETALRMARKGFMRTLDVDKVHGEFQAACRKGYKPRMEAVHPPGCEDAVQGLKKKFGDSDSTYKIAWWMKENNRCG